MTDQNEIQKMLHNSSLSKSALQGAGLAVALVIIFLAIIFPIGGVLDGKNFWQGIWEFFPLVTAAAGGALGGIIYHLILKAWYLEGWKKLIVTILSLLIYVLILWLSLVAGFSVTGRWD